ncbi:MAG: NYN domain-containing protein [Peptoniphilaceae bacterium]|nr:NYN domain-containing protein [Peptoniphilaceae bacterium]
MFNQMSILGSKPPTIRDELRPRVFYEGIYIMKTAILVDGGYYRKIAIKAFDNSDAELCARDLINYCNRHLMYRMGGQKCYAELYRIFYYDCPPLSKQVFHPLYQRSFDFSKSKQYIWMNKFLEELTKKRKVALRLGQLSDYDNHYSLRYETLKKLMNGSITVQDLKESDFVFETRQKGVDMKIGVDITSLAYKKQVDQIVLIAGDSDFVPAAKLARREGIDFILDALGRPIKHDLFEHIDGLRSKDDRLKIKN